jgi:hypothetical protein
MKQSVQHKTKFFLFNKFCLKKIDPLGLELSGFKERTRSLKFVSILEITDTCTFLYFLCGKFNLLPKICPLVVSQT